MSKLERAIALLEADPVAYKQHLISVRDAARAKLDDPCHDMSPRSRAIWHRHAQRHFDHAVARLATL